MDTTILGWCLLPPILSYITWYTRIKPTYHQYLIGSAIERIQTDNWHQVHPETLNTLDHDTDLTIEPFHMIGQAYYEERIREPEDPEHVSHFISKIAGLFVPPNRIYVNPGQDEHELERTIIHEIEHYHNHFDYDSGDLSNFQDEFLSIKAEDEYSGKYMTRGYLRRLAKSVQKMFDDPDDCHRH